MLELQEEKPTSLVGGKEIAILVCVAVIGPLLDRVGMMSIEPSATFTRAVLRLNIAKAASAVLRWLSQQKSKVSSRMEITRNSTFRSFLTRISKKKKTMPSLGQGFQP